MLRLLVVVFDQIFLCDAKTLRRNILKSVREDKRPETLMTRRVPRMHFRFFEA
ncbi:MAG: hypothetical protein WCK65_15935 [Rhodospirillaceae bacterium]